MKKLVYRVLMKAIREIFKYPKGQPRRNYGNVLGIHRASTLYPGLLSANVVSFWFCYVFFVCGSMPSKKSIKGGWGHGMASNKPETPNLV